MIKSIELNNYRIYKGINKIVFQNGNNKNLFLISGENGFGKTTFYTHYFGAYMVV